MPLPHANKLKKFTGRNKKMETFTVNLGVTPINLWLLLTGQAAYAGASVQGSRRMSTPNAPLCKELLILGDDANTNTVYGGVINTVSATDYGFRVGAGEEHRQNMGGEPSVPLTLWLVGGAASQKIRVKITW